MIELNALKWSDINSPTMNLQDYLKLFKKKPAIAVNYNKYVPNESILYEIKKISEESGGKFRILAIGAAWCHDCALEVPRIVKIAESLPDSVDLKILYGVKVDPYDRKNGVRWSERHSPPEAVDPKFDLHHIPMFYIFSPEGKFLGRIIEHPKHTKTLEGDILHYISQ